MANHDYVLDDNPGATFRTDVNAVLQAIVTNNSSATEPAVTFPNMWWYDTSTATLKRRNNANDAWIVMGLEAADTDGTLAANSDSKVATQKATKTYVDAKTIAENRLSLSDNTTANATTSAHGFLKKLSNVATEFMNGVGNWVVVTIDSILPSQTGNSGKFLTTNGSASSWGDVTIPTVKQVLCGVSTTTSASARYVGLFSSVENASITPDQKTYFPIAGTLKNMYFSCQNTNVDITIYKNGSATTLTLRSIYGVASDTTHTVAIAAGDYISVLHSAPASGMLSLEFDPS